MNSIEGSPQNLNSVVHTIPMFVTAQKNNNKPIIVMLHTFIIVLMQARIFHVFFVLRCGMSIFGYFKMESKIYISIAQCFHSIRFCNDVYGELLYDDKNKNFQWIKNVTICNFLLRIFCDHFKIKICRNYLDSFSQKSLSKSYLEIKRIFKRFHRKRSQPRKKKGKWTIIVRATYHCQFDSTHEAQKKFPESLCEHDVMKGKNSFIFRLRVKLQWQEKKDI